MYTLNTKRDLDSQLSPAALGHAELFGEAVTSPSHFYLQLSTEPSPHSSTEL